MGRIWCDDPLENDIIEILESFKRRGFKNIKKPDVIRILVGKYKENKQRLKLKRKPKSKKYELRGPFI